MKRSVILLLGVAVAVALRGPVADLLYSFALNLGGRGLAAQSQSLIAMVCDGTVMIAAVWVATGRLKLDRGRAFPLAWPRDTTLAAAGIGVAVALMNVFVVRRFFPQATASSATVATYLAGSAGAFAHLALGFGLAVFSPVVEEIFFRGLLQQGLDEAVPYVGLLAATALFVAEHPGSSTSPAVWILGLALALIYRRTQSVSATIVCHVVNNALVLYVLRG